MDWQAVRRPLNAEADRLATQGTRWARALRRSGVTEVRQHIEWESGCPRGDVGWNPPGAA